MPPHTTATTSTKHNKAHSMDNACVAVSSELCRDYMMCVSTIIARVAVHRVAGRDARIASPSEPPSKTGRS